MSDLKKIIGSNIKRLRERMGLKQEDIASYLDVPREEISYYETGARAIPLPKLNQIATLLYVSISDLLEENEGVAEANAAFAFRATDLSKDDIKSISQFLKIVKGHIKMQELSKTKSNESAD